MNTRRTRIFWNNFDAVLTSFNRRISGNDGLYWHNHIIQTYGLQERALILGCGNGWVERDLFAKGFIRSAVGIDPSEPLLSQARAEAEAVGLAAEYACADMNGFEQPGLRADVAVSVGALQRVRFLNRVLETVARIVQGGLYVGYDYTGPHRHQYGWPTWSAALELNQQLPERFRVTLRYPDLDTITAADPDDAVHSELFLEVLLRHFDLVECQPLGGGLAYLLLMDNHALLDEQHQPEGRATVERVMAADAALAAQVPEANLFTFIVARPKKVPAPAYQRSAWQSDEDEREFHAAASGQRYYPATALGMIYSGIGSVRPPG